MKTYFLFATLLASAYADVYMHFPPGSNGRNRERNDNRNNGNRLFDTQNNAKGGYPWRGDPKRSDIDDGMVFTTGSKVHIKWTNQHGCGENPTTHCTTVIQVGCDGTTKQDGTDYTEAERNGPNYSAGTLPGLRDGYPTGQVQSQPKGQNDNDNNKEPKYLERKFQTANQNGDGTNTIPENEQQAGCRQSKTKKSLGGKLFADAEYLTEGTCAPPIDDDDPQHGAREFGMHEDFYYYRSHCRYVQRNNGLYTADRKINRKDASATRQNPNGNRRGFECPEERDYYPWWNPSPWIDVAVLTSDVAWCPYYQKESQNVKERGYCDVSMETLKQNENRRVAPIQELECEQLLGQSKWRTVQPFNKWPEYEGVIQEPECKLAEYSPQNSLGFVDGGTDYATYVWTVPEFKSPQKCVIRIRYNISTEDYPSMAGFIEPTFVQVVGTSNGKLPKDSESVVPDADVSAIFDKRFNCPYIQSKGNGNDVDAATGGTGGTSGFDCLTGLKTKYRPRYNRPEINPFGTDKPALSIALNTDQAGRTFQDRSYVMNIEPRSSTKKFDGCDAVINVGLMGKRGNIVQSYPAIEYDWSPDNVNVKQGECLDFHLHGSDFNTNRNPNNGEGWKYSDRTNIMQKKNAAHNFPAFDEVFEKGEAKAFFNKDERYKLAYLGQKEKLEALNKECLKEDDDDVDDQNNDPRICGKLNSAPNHYKLMKKVDASVGTYDFISTRNNNFSNRAHTLKIIVAEGRSREAEERAQKEAQSAAVAGGIGGFIVAVIILGLIGAGVWFVFFRGKEGPCGGDDETPKSGGNATTITHKSTTEKKSAGEKV